MHSRLLAGWKGLFLAAAVASLVLLPMTGASAAAPAKPADAGAQSLRPVDSDTDTGLPTLYPRANYQWPYATGPFVGDVATENLHAKGVLVTVAGAFDTSRGLNIPQELRTTNKLGKQKAQYFLLQVDTETFADGTFAQLKDTVEAAGGALVQNLGPGAFIVRLTANAYASMQGQGVRYLEPYHPAFKLDPNIGRIPLADPAKALSSVYSLEIRLFPGEDASQVALAIRALGGTVTSVVADAVSANVDRSKLADVAALEPVYAVFEEGYYVPLDEKATTTVQTGKWNQGAVPYHEVGGDGGGGDQQRA